MEVLTLKTNSNISYVKLCGVYVQDEFKFAGENPLPYQFYSGDSTYSRAMALLRETEKYVEHAQKIRPGIELAIQYHHSNTGSLMTVIREFNQGLNHYVNIVEIFG